MKPRYTKRYIYIIACSIAYCMISSSHEPWFDEAQAWQIAKCASIPDILFDIPHYEGHPPLWHLLLAMLAKLGVPFEIGIKGIGLLIYIGVVYLIVFQSPFPKPAKYLLPLSYFPFYQYGVVVRPYGLMILTLLFLAMAYSNRHAKPWRFICLLAILCLESAYGMLISFGLALCFTWEIISEKGFVCTARDVLTDERTKALCLLLVVGVVLATVIVPREDTWITVSENRNPLWLCMLVTFLTMPGECMLTSASWFMVDRNLLQNAALNVSELVVFAIIGVILWTLILSVGTKRNLAYLLVPYAVLAFFCAAVYMNGHHIGIFGMVLLFWLWIAFVDSDRFELGLILLRRLSANERDQRLATKVAVFVSIACLLMPCWWTVGASVTDIRNNYSHGRDIAAYLKNNGLDGARVLSAWGGTWASDGIDGYSNSMYGGMSSYRPSALYVSIPVEVCAYFDRNICYDLNGGCNEEAYFHYRLVRKEDDERTLEGWRQVDTPEVLLSKPDLAELYGDDITYDDYVLAHVVETRMAWKAGGSGSLMPLYVHKDIAVSKGIKPVDGGAAYLVDGLSFTDEMRERYEAGEPIEEILDPYLDEMFGEN